MEIAKYIEEELRGIPGVDVTIIPNDESLHEHPVMPYVPRVKVEWDKEDLGFSPSDVDRLMAAEDPPVFLRKGIYFNYYSKKAWRLIDTFYLREGEAEIVAERLRRILSGGGHSNQ